MVIPAGVCKTRNLVSVHRQRNFLQTHMRCAGSSKTSPLFLVGSSLEAMTLMIILKFQSGDLGSLSCLRVGEGTSGCKEGGRWMVWDLPVGCSVNLGRYICESIFTGAGWLCCFCNGCRKRDAPKRPFN